MRTAHRRILLPAALCCVAALFGFAPAANASNRQLSVMMDDDLMLYSGDVERDATLEGMRRLGVDVVRLTVLWNVFAPRHRPRDPADPAQYNPAILNRLDRAVIGSLQRGIIPYFNVTPPGPAWARTRTPNKALTRLRSYKPKRAEFAKFVEMLGKRYGGTYRDENDGRGLIPRVRVWSIGNEPNQGGWLTPQSERQRGRWVAAAPHLYRGLYVSARSALDRSGHGNDQILMGELAPLGVSNADRTAPLRPLKFLREMFCLDGHYRPLRGRSARIRDCDNHLAKSKIRTTGIAYHPYTRQRSPFTRPRSRDEATISNLKRLTAALDRIADRTHRVDSKLPVWVTEFGYESNPPDRFRGVPVDRQAQYVNEGDFIAYRNPRVASTAQFLFRDAAPNSRHTAGTRDNLGTYQSGLFFSNTTAKPAFQAYGLPIHIRDAGGSVVNVWGQLRFRPNGSGANAAELQFRPEGSGTWVPYQGLTTNNPMAFMEKTVQVPANGAMRIAWRDDAGTIQATSREVPVRRR